MASTILSDNGVSSGSAGIKTTADGTGALALQTTTAGGTATTAVTIDTSQNVTLAGTLTIGTATQAIPSGTAPLFAARAWVNFNGTGTVAIRASGNVSSITDNGTGLYVVNFTTAMTDTSYAAVVSYSPSYGVSGSAGASIAAGTGSLTEVAPTTTTFAFGTLILTSSGTFHDPKYVNVSVFR